MFLSKYNEDEPLFSVCYISCARVSMGFNCATPDTVCLRLTTRPNQPDTKSNPNRNTDLHPTTKQHAVASIQLTIQGGSNSKPLPND